MGFSKEKIHQASDGGLHLGSESGVGAELEKKSAHKASALITWSSERHAFFSTPSMLGSHQNPCGIEWNHPKKKTSWNWYTGKHKDLSNVLNKKTEVTRFLKFWLLYEDPYVMAYYNRYRIGVVQSPNSKQPEFFVTAQFCWDSWNLFVHPKGG